ncbi:DUF3248 domain-containing protein [Deinococcus radiopugnans]|uniref:DUF3248 domain-containing protein n=1 Tax=Deinococcus radiopugnans ATCC 19172 TaxID=585398 RepID=A0A5C4Y2L3_9DEIO|nr:DUF3248 domain-containing protein [Deinococcus radiopugnans]MBB6017816.1 phage terminase large subunit GpA-like protein [Deinococcus radiopugnans ATCC 19172]TNM69546.1 DUF3248 domain-containing protein [Deinococcus radiopugnans ATCC 19172]
MSDPLPPGSPEELPAGLLPQELEVLGGQLVWRIGKDEVSDDVIVRLGYASATPRFAHLPRLRSANDADLLSAMEGGRVVIEWVD